MADKEIKEAAALSYKEGGNAPEITALGKGAIAEAIIKTAIENSVPVHKDPQLAKTLNLLKLGDEIPEELYEVVAKILLFVGDLDALRSRL